MCGLAAVNEEENELGRPLLLFVYASFWWMLGGNDSPAKLKEKEGENVEGMTLLLCSLGPALLMRGGDARCRGAGCPAEFAEKEGDIVGLPMLLLCVASVLLMRSGDTRRGCDGCPDKFVEKGGENFCRPLCRPFLILRLLSLFVI